MDVDLTVGGGAPDETPPHGDWQSGTVVAIDQAKGDGLDEYGVDSEGIRRLPGRHPGACTCNKCVQARVSGASDGVLRAEKERAASEVAEKGKRAPAGRASRKEPQYGRNAMSYADRTQHDTALMLPLAVAYARYKSTKTGKLPKAIEECAAVSTAVARATAKYKVPMSEEIVAVVAVGAFMFSSGDDGTPEMVASANAQLTSDLQKYMSDVLGIKL